MIKNDMQQVTESIKSKSIKTHKFDDKSFVCLFENSKVIEFDVTDDDRICLTYHEANDEDYCQTVYRLDEFSDTVLEEILSDVDTTNSYVEFLSNETHKTFLKNFLK